MIQIFTLLIFILSFPFFALAKEAPSEDIVILPPGGVPGQIEEAGNLKRIYFEEGVFAEWSGKRVDLKSLKGKEIGVDLSASPDQVSARQVLGEEVVEQDLGGTLKKKAPLAHKNPKFRNIQLPKGGEDPLKGSGMQPSRVFEEKTPEGGKQRVSEYPDGSRSVAYTSSDLKEESSFNRRGDLIWRNIEGETRGVKFRKTQWEDGSIIREYSRSEGTLSVVHDLEKNTYTFSFLNPNRELLKEVICQKGECD